MRVFPIDAPLAGRLLIVSRPVGGEVLSEEIAAFRREGISIVVSLLQVEEQQELELLREEELCRANGINFLCHPIADRGLPADPNATRALAGELAGRLHRGETVAIHCRAGIGRSALMAAAVLVSAGIDGPDAIPLISAARGLRVPDTDEQRVWISEFRP